MLTESEVTDKSGQAFAGGLVKWQKWTPNWLKSWAETSTHVQEKEISGLLGFFGRLSVGEVDEGEVVDLLGPLDSTAADVAEELEQLVLGDGRRQVANEQNLHLKQQSATNTGQSLIK